MIRHIDLGVLPYQAALQLQKQFSVKRRKKEISDHLLLVEHPSVYTFGKRDATEDLLMTEDWLKEQGMDIIKTDRGGRVTYHGPGQLVGYLIFAVKGSIPHLVFLIEETLIHVLNHFKIPGERDKDYPGIWVNNEKIAALGLHIDRGVTTHGFSLNINCNLAPFSYIHPCGIKNRGVTSLRKILGKEQDMKEIKKLVIQEFKTVFKNEFQSLTDSSDSL